MSPDDLLALFRLPAAAVLERRVAKDDLSAQLAKPNDRTLVKQRVEALVWHAGLNHDNTGLPPEGITGLAIVTLITRKPDDEEPTHHHLPPRLVNLIHRTVPDPLILLTACDTPVGPQATTLSIKPALGEALSAELAPVDDALPTDAAPLLAVDRAASLSDLHRRWSEAVLGLATYQTTQHFPKPEGGGIKDFRGRREALDRLLALDKEILKLTQQARRETQAGRRAELNERLQRARRERQTVAEAI